MNNVNTEVLSGARAIALASVAGAILCVPLAAAAQVAVEAGAIAKSTTAAPAKAAMGAPAGGPVQMTISMAPAPAAAVPTDSRGPNCTGAIRNESNIIVPVGKSSLIPLPEPVRNRTLGNPNVVQATMVSPQTLYVLGRSVGTTNMIVQGRSGGCSIINVVVNADAGGLQTSLAQLMPGEPQIRVLTAADNLVLSGSVSNAQAAQQAMEIAYAYAAAAQGEGNKKGGVLNMLSVDTPQQVMLEVKVAEVSKTLLNQLGSAVNLQGGFGSWSGGLVTSLLSGASGAIFANKANNRPFNVAVDAQKNDSLVKILAEPNLVTISGQEASFLAGGKIYIPVAQSNALGGASTITLQQEEFGVGLKFTPTVLANGRINLRVAPEVSELSPTGATVSGSSLTGQTILPLITTRRASTTVQMRDGESFAIGGLLQNSARGSLKALPGAGEVPVLGTLFRSTSFQQDLTELVFIITPHLVQPMQSASYPLPTDSFSTPNPLALYLMGNMEGSGKKTDAPSPTPSQPAPAAPAPTAVPAAPAPQAPKAPLSMVPPAKPLDDVPVISPPAPRASAAGVPPADATAARIARIEATAARLAQARAATTASPSGLAPDKARPAETPSAN
ncbi:type II and III secretion system protein family protein [Cupriavidus basilensis]|uniref:Type II/IV secretion system secretin RcpA/CpaC, associated with Flp pilus assembly n=1 Tax=Cupriavidus basilensis TaxID=68895 RepID=A0A0C4Y5J8_9BURK|nr:type II and III secretion system protein family protein [Cupriavidus basilensis]AJG18265.1 Type II/IV secretion system secretin RcpA/CpaC, associated with Flp pilus assembly [Cupriavidus basilensis]